MKKIKNYTKITYLDFLATILDGAWFNLAFEDLKKRYRRSLIGPFWITLSTFILVMVIGPLYGVIFNRELNDYFPFLTAGIIIWQFFSTYVNESVFGFIENEGYIKNIKAPYFTYILKLFFKNFLVFLHNFIIIVLIILYFGIMPNIIMFLFGIFLFTINLLWIGTLLAIFSARFRDMPQIISNLVQVSFFLTPIIWQIDMAGRHFYFINFNPIYHFIEILRAPLINSQINNLSYIFSSFSACIGILITVYFFGRFNKRFSFWV
jgi:lipopolysaccharide transport system permease protein